MRAHVSRDVCACGGVGGLGGAGLGELGRASAGDPGERRQLLEGRYSVQPQDAYRQHRAAYRPHHTAAEMKALEEKASAGAADEMQARKMIKNLLYEKASWNLSKILSVTPRRPDHGPSMAFAFNVASRHCKGDFRFTNLVKSNSAPSVSIESTT